MKADCKDIGQAVDLLNQIAEIKLVDKDDIKQITVTDRVIAIHAG